MEKMEIRLAGGVVEFIFGPSQRISFGDENQPGLEIGRDSKSKKVVAFMCLHFPALYQRVLFGLREKPIERKFSVMLVEDYEKSKPICDARVKDATLAEIVQWVWENYYAPLEEKRAAEAPTEYESRRNKRASSSRPADARVKRSPLQPS